MTLTLLKMRSITKRLNKVVQQKRAINNDYDLETNLYRKLEVEKEMGKTNLMDPTEMLELTNQVEDFIKTGGTDAKKKVHKLMDINKDGKVDKKDAKDLAKTILYFSLIVYGILLFKEREAIGVLIAGGDWVGLASFLETAIVLQGFVIVLSFFYEKFKKQVIDDDKKVKEAETKAIEAEAQSKMLQDLLRQQQLKFELEQYRTDVKFEVEKLQYTSEADIVVKVKDAIARLEIEYNNRLQKLLGITQPSANTILDMNIQDLPNIQKTGIVNSIVTIQKQETSTLCKESVSSVPVAPKTDKPSETLNQVPTTKV